MKPSKDGKTYVQWGKAVSPSAANKHAKRLRSRGATVRLVKTNKGTKLFLHEK